MEHGVQKFGNVCRTCLCGGLASDRATMLSVAEHVDSDRNVRLSDMLYECTSIQISIDDRLPKSICARCVGQISASYEFKLNCLEAERTLLNQLLSDEHDDHEVKEEQNDDEQASDREPKRCSRRLRDKKKPRLKVEVDKKWFIKLSDDAYKCTQCDVVASKRSSLKTHVNECHEEAYKFKCEHCHEIFTKQYSLKRHLLARHPAKDVEVDIKLEDVDVEVDVKAEDDVADIGDIADDADRALAEENIERVEEHGVKCCYRCKICGFEKPNKTNMIQHVYFHMNIRRFKCPLCDKVFVTRGNLSRHVLNVHDDGPAAAEPGRRACKVCCDDSVFQSAQELQRHMDGVHNDQATKGCSPAVCGVCHKQMYNSHALRKHMHSMHRAKRHKCDLCTMSFHSEKSLLGHRRVHGIKSGHHCKYCIQTCPSEEALHAHIDVAHTNAPLFKCTVCPKEFYIESYLLKHIRNHEAKPKHLCTTCGKTFLLKSNLTTHQRVHTGEKPYKCDVCSASFGQHAALRFHLAVHTDERKFECSVCSTKWKRKIDLTQHMRIHTDMPHFKCNFCGKEFIFRKRLTCHMKIHTGEKPYECTTCGKKFTRGSHLKVHTRIHTGERPFVCSVCGRGFIQNHCLITHLNAHHKMQPAEQEAEQAEQQQQQ